MRKKENRSITIDKDLLNKIDKKALELKENFSAFTSIAYEFYIKYENELVNKNQNISGRGFEVVSTKNRIGEFVKLPQQGSENSAGYDFYLPENVVIPPKEGSKLIFTNVKAFMNRGEVLKLYIRSSIGIKQGIVLKNGTGIIDADYFNNENNEGNIGIVLYNTTSKTVILNEGERIMQGIFTPYLKSSNCNTISQRKGGFGSTDKL